MNWQKPVLAEFIGTFFLCFAGIAAICSTKIPGAAMNDVGVALAHGLALSIAINCFGGISGGHFNPAVTAGMLITGRIDGMMAARYVGSQLAGATVAALACMVIFPTDIENSVKLGTPLPSTTFADSTGIVLLTEFILTFLLVTAVFGTAVDERGKAVKIGSFGIGLTVAFDILAGGNVSGASMNPARSFGPTLIHGGLEGWKWLWVYWLAPLAGGVVAALVYQHFLLEPAETPIPSPQPKPDAPGSAAASRA
jgi:aquaporin TIP